MDPACITNDAISPISPLGFLLFSIDKLKNILKHKVAREHNNAKLKVEFAFIY
jgi:hypothetical protein